MRSAFKFDCMYRRFDECLSCNMQVGGGCSHHDHCFSVSHSCLCCITECGENLPRVPTISMCTYLIGHTEIGTTIFQNAANLHLLWQPVVRRPSYINISVPKNHHPQHNGSPKHNGRAWPNIPTTTQRRPGRRRGPRRVHAFLRMQIQQHKSTMGMQHRI